MSIALSEDQRALAQSVRSYISRADPLAEARESLDNPTHELPSGWSTFAELGWLGVHLPEEYGGAGFGLPELSVVVEELGSAVTPGPLLPTVWASAVIAAAGAIEQQAELLPGLIDGTVVAAVGIAATATLSGVSVEIAEPVEVLCAAMADILLVAIGEDVVVLRREQVQITGAPTLDPTRPLSAVTTNGSVDAVAVLPGASANAVSIGRTLAAAEAAGVVTAATNLAVEYAKARFAFGRAIGSFQSVKHILANMLVDREMSTAAAWDAAQAAYDNEDQSTLTAAVAVVTALPAAMRVAQKCIQVHGGIGYTWEHDAHLYLRRAGALNASFSPVVARADIADATAAGIRRESSIELPAEADEYRTQARAFVKEAVAAPADQLRRLLVDSGYAVPHWPKPWGRGAGAVEQLVLEEELSALELPQYGIGEWVLLTVVGHGTAEQHERFVDASLMGTVKWCQLFSEPGAGSDAAGITTRARRVDGGWIVNGQKTWTSGGVTSTHGMATVRTDPEARKHKGITMMLIDMSAPGVQVRPIKQITGDSHFSEVFLDDVFVPDADVLGEVNGGWGIARSALGNERVTIGRERLGLGVTYSIHDLFTVVREQNSGMDDTVADLVAEDLALRALTTRIAELAVLGAGPGPEGAVLKLVGSEHGQRLADAGLLLSGFLPAGSELKRPVHHSFLEVRFQTIAGGTSEILRNQIGELILGLPREPALA
ncbi:MAG: acyl-CoA dehydrogenase [Rhodococcus sp. (in: high G+C Gram-positive bacteria)]|uniref:acyl-CoA dehydrogenase n=1 Tax=Rhodococcus sp. TaxID=1831 RepID=UPI001217F67A|nr:acyl-CoA dehydrogenase [Rhodococcus sp. (in: high G+C Gram-positive bacteria)]RZL21913.1 MAG: acyl-CoA dehydrogenase [Rhodococcus sp. (in: high G+C Gram-positive bacteria)]